MFGNLSIRSKLLGLVAVPLAGACLLGGVGVTGPLADRARADSERRLADVAELAATALHDLQEERVLAAALVAGRGRAGEAALAARRRRVDQAVAAYQSGAEGLVPDDAGDPALVEAVVAAGRWLDRLAVVRAEADQRLVTPARIVADHDAAVTALLAVLGELVNRLEAPTSARSARLLQAVAAAKDATGRERALLATAAPASRPDIATSSERARRPHGKDATPSAAAEQPAQAEEAPLRLTSALRARVEAAVAVAGYTLGGVRAAAGDRAGDVERALAVPRVRGTRRLELALLALTPAPEGGGQRPAAGERASPDQKPPQTERPAADQTPLQTEVAAADADPLQTEVAAADLERLQAGLAARARVLRRVEQGAGRDLAAGAAAWRERQEARVRLPLLVLAVVALGSAAVGWLLFRDPGGGSDVAAAAPGTVAGLARRGRAAAERQVQLLEELEREEPDPARRDGLQRVQQQAARLRRSAETLVAMTGPEPARPTGRPLPVAGLLRAAVAEIDASRRIDLLATDDVEVTGPVVADLVHLLAELLDNAAGFSPPTSTVAVTGTGDGDGYLVEISDCGLGMADEELAWANQRLAGRGPAGLELAGDRLGLVVAGRLAGRHGLAVRLTHSPTGGVTASVRLPATLLATRDGAAATMT